MLTTNELRDQLVADVAEAPTNADRTSQVRGRVRVQRRRRAAVSGVATVAVIAVAALVVVPQLGNENRTGNPPAASPSARDVPLPGFHLGGQLIAQTEHSGPAPFTVPFTASNAELMLTLDCYVPGAGADAPMVDIKLGGTLVAAFSCSSSAEFTGSNTFTPDPTTLDDVHAGQPDMLFVSFRDDVPVESRIRIGVYESVPLASYQFPPAPTPLPELEPSGNLVPSTHPHALVLLSGGPLTEEFGAQVVATQGTWVQTITLRRGLTIDGQTAAPGKVTVEVDGKEIDAFSGWDYTQAGYGRSFTLDELGLEAGAQVVLRVTTERFPPSSWAVLFSDDAP